MNWTGGRLSRHSGKRRGNLVNIQKQHFAKVRANLQDGSRGLSPLKLTFFDKYQSPRVKSTSHRSSELPKVPRRKHKSRLNDQRPITGEQDLGRPSKDLSTSRNQYESFTDHRRPYSQGKRDDEITSLDDEEQIRKPSSFFLVKAEENELDLYDEHSPQQEKRHQSPSNVPLQTVPLNPRLLPFEDRKRKLLEEPDWVGTSRTRPPQFKYSTAGARQEIGKRRRINDDDRRRHAEFPRRPYQPLFSEKIDIDGRQKRSDIRPDPLLQYFADDWDIGEQALSIHIGQQHQASQSSSQWSGIATSPAGRVRRSRSSSELMLLDREFEGRDRMRIGQAQQGGPAAVPMSRVRMDSRPGSKTSLANEMTSSSKVVGHLGNTENEHQIISRPRTRYSMLSNLSASNLIDVPSSDRNLTGSPGTVSLSTVPTQDHLPFHKAARLFPSRSTRKQLSEQAQPQPKINEMGCEEVGADSMPPESPPQSHGADESPKRSAPLEARTLPTRLVFETSLLPRSPAIGSDPEVSASVLSQSDTSVRADAGTQEDGISPAAQPEDVLWRDWLAIPATTTMNASSRAPVTETESSSVDLDNHNVSTRKCSRIPVTKALAGVGPALEQPTALPTGVSTMGANPQTILEVHEPVETDASLNPASHHAQAITPIPSEVHPVSKPVNPDELWMKFVFGDSDDIETDIFNNTIDTKNSVGHQEDNEKSTLSGSSSMIAQASTAPLPTNHRKPQPSPLSSSDRAKEAAKFLFSDWDTDSLLPHRASRRPAVSEDIISTISTSDTHARQNPHYALQSDSVSREEISMKNDNSSPSTPSLAQASLQNHDPAATSSPDPLIAARPHQKRHRIVFSKPAPFIGRRAQLAYNTNPAVFHIGRKMNGKAKVARKDRRNEKSIYDIPDDDEERDGGKEAESEESIEDD